VIGEALLTGIGIGTSFGGAVGVLAGRKLGWNDAYQSGRLAQKVMDDYADQHPLSASVRLQQMRANPAPVHPVHPGEPCTDKCYNIRK
jgi:hypothetical protein